MLLFSDGPRGLLPSGAVVKALDVERVPLPAVPGLDAPINEGAFAARAGVASFLRGPLRLVHHIWFLVPLLVSIGVVLSIREAPEATILWLIVPIYYLVFESPFLYEWRVAVPMQYFLLPFAAKTLTNLAAWPRKVNPHNR